MIRPRGRRVLLRWWAVCAADLVVTALWAWLSTSRGDQTVDALALAGASLAFASAVVCFVLGYTQSRPSVRTGSRGTG